MKLYIYIYTVQIYIRSDPKTLKLLAERHAAWSLVPGTLSVDAPRNSGTGRDGARHDAEQNYSPQKYFWHGATVPT